MPISERVESWEGLRRWSGTISLHYRYTAGVAGERFLSGLRRGKLYAAKCGKCGTAFIPPRIYCVKCFRKVEDFVPVAPRGRLMSISTPDRDGARFAFVKFGAVEGGLVHRVQGRSPRVGEDVKVVFRPKREREGSILDIQGFQAEPARPRAARRLRAAATAPVLARRGS